MVSVDLQIQLQLSDDTEQKARESGLLTAEKISALIEAEVQRQRKEAWARLQEMLEPVQADFRAEYSDLNDDAFMEMVQGEVLEVREEMYRERTDNTAPRESDS